MTGWSGGAGCPADVRPGMESIGVPIVGKLLVQVAPELEQLGKRAYDDAQSSAGCVAGRSSEVADWTFLHLEAQPTRLDQQLGAKGGAPGVHGDALPDPAPK